MPLADNGSVRPSLQPGSAIRQLQAPALEDFFLVRFRHSGEPIDTSTQKPYCRGFIVSKSNLYVRGLKFDKSIFAVGTSAELSAWNVRNGYGFDIQDTRMSENYSRLGLDRSQLAFDPTSVIQAFESALSYAQRGGGPVAKGDQTIKGVAMAATVIAEAARFPLIQGMVWLALQPQLKGRPALPDFMKRAPEELDQDTQANLIGEWGTLSGKVRAAPDSEDSPAPTVFKDYSYGSKDSYAGLVAVLSAKAASDGG